MTSFLLFLFYDNHFLRRKSKLHLIMPFRKEDILTVDFILILSRCKMQSYALDRGHCRADAFVIRLKKNDNLLETLIPSS